MPSADPPSPAELAFLEMLSKPRVYGAWAELCRKRWTAERARAITKASESPRQPTKESKE